ncbi:predicted protein [Chaetomium globosum CBS 148.51]|uniref:Uncharacterized protein n=1 Tax=Chaetomium globosum (strain ATCC 6205 / CBS 148.51 / DSM 1962 / NBRC 6347 / NRRL 1970) TaxID=306901 RepID=Q2H8V9_CHAGB|nr:uncharacterized protein CHGG_03345 [Chaetomium globosum CBS 148.51]EAQ91410.1 predicted protein [Chaetomium globosum CBS 148.51]
MSQAVSGWDCLGDAAQFGIILVIVAVVLALVYLYWRLQIKPGLQSGRDDSQNPVTGHWELSRRDPSRVSITIYREPRQLSDPEPVETDGPISPPGKGQIGQTQQQENNILGQVPQQLGMAHTSDIHLVPPPPPPPPVVWSASPSSTVPQPPIVGPIAFVQSGHPPATFHSTPLTLGTTTVPYPADVPPPYFGYANLQGQYPQAEVVPVPQPACAPPPVTPSTPTRNKKEKNVPTTPVAEPQSKWRRWFSRGKSPATGHARTLSDSSSPGQPVQVTVTSTISDPITSAQAARDRRHNTPPSESESSISSSYLNTSLEAVLNTNNPHPTRSTRTRTRPRPRPRAFSNPETTQPHHQHPNRAPQTRIRPSDTVPLAHDLHRRQLSDDSRQPGPSQRQRQRQRRHPTPSPDLQFPSPERRRPRVSFTLPEEEEQEGRGGVLGASSSAGSSSVSLGSLESGRSVELRGEGRSRERETRGGGGGGRRREEEEEEAEEEGRRPGVADRVTRGFI